MTAPTPGTDTAPPDPTRPPVGAEPHRVAVTGADSGIGRACAVALAAPGRHVGITWHRDEAGAEATADEVRGRGATAHVRHLDLTDPPAGGRVVDDVTGASWPVDGGMLQMGPMAGSHLESHDWRRP